MTLMQDLGLVVAAHSGDSSRESDILCDGVQRCVFVGW